MIRRMQPPVGYRLSIPAIARAATALVPLTPARAALERQMSEHFGVDTCVAVNSGKAALTIALRALHAITGKTKVVLPAYTCYSVPSAIVKAGLVPVPCDIAPDSFDYDYEQLAPRLDDPDTLCALSVHLFGIPADTHRLAALCRPRQVFVVEDAAQAVGAEHNGERLGTRGDVGFFSFGRGKNVTCGAGGMILTGMPAVAREIQRLAQALPSPSRASAVKSLAEMCAMSLFLAPYLYWVPASIPALKLGETIFYRDFPVERLMDCAARLLDAWPQRLAALNRARLANAAYYRRHLAAGHRDDESIAYLRYPLVVGDRAVRDRLLRRGREVGISRMYPTSVGSIPELRGVLSTYDFPEAERRAACLVTLPTHPLLTEADRQRVCEIANASGADALAAIDNQRVTVQA